jgi:hypothetical protein
LYFALQAGITKPERYHDADAMQWNANESLFGIKICSKLGSASMLFHRGSCYFIIEMPRRTNGDGKPMRSFGILCCSTLYGGIVDTWQIAV